jgi:Glycosyltransferases involved in cell wall biogenesis
VTANPRVQVLLSTFNGAKFIDEQLHSLLIQQGVEVSVLIRDDGSQDDTVERIRHLAERHPAQITLLRADNRKLPFSFMELIRLTSNTADYYAFCDQDDIWEQGKLARAVAMLQSRDPNRPLLYCSSTTLVDRNLNVLGKGPSVPNRCLTLQNALLENVAIGCTCVFNNCALSLVKKHLPRQYDRIVMHDWWLYLSVSAFGEVVYDKESYILYRQHSASTVGGSVNAIGQWKKRVRKYVGGKMSHVHTRQASKFIECYESELNPRFQEEIRRFIDSQQQGWGARLAYALSSPLYRQSALDNLVYKLLILLGKA